MPSNPYCQGANVFAYTKSTLTNETHRITDAAGHSIVKECRFSGVGVEITHAPGQTSILTLDRTLVRDSTILTGGAICADRSSIHGSRLSAANSLRFERSCLRQTYLRIQPGTGLAMSGNDVDELYIEGSGSFSHVFNLEGLFSRCRFKGLKVFDGNVKGIFFKNQWKDLLIRQSAFIDTVFNHCFMDEVVIKDSALINVTLSMCKVPGKPITFEGCDITFLRVIGMKKCDFLFKNCTGLSTVLFSY